MGTPRFYAPNASASGVQIELPDEEATHLTRVLRLTPGAEVRVFDGQGHEWHATVDRVSKQHVAVTLHEAATAAPEPQIALTLALGVLKGDKMDTTVRDAVMLGVAAIQPIITARTEIAATALQKGSRVARWRRIAVSSAKQCGRAVVPAIHAPIALNDAVQVVTEMTVMLVEPTVDAAARVLSEVPATSAATLLVGPEGGWTSDEVRRAEAHGAILMTLGRATLRADAVPLVALTALRVHWGDF